MKEKSFRVLLYGCLAGLTIGCLRQSGANPEEQQEKIPVVKKKDLGAIERTTVAKKKAPGAIARTTVAKKKQPPETKRITAPVLLAQKQDKVAGGPKKTAAVDGFSFPADKGGKLLGDLLRPEEKNLALLGSKRPKRLAGPAYLERPEIPAPVYQGQPPRSAPKMADKPIRPRPVPEELPLSHYRGEPKKPQVVQLPAEALIRWPTPDPNQPALLPILAQPRIDRAPLADPTVDASTEAALAGSIPVRLTPAPFLRLTLPDPFEHRQAVRLRNPVDEDSAPQSAGSRPPAK